MPDQTTAPAPATITAEALSQLTGYKVEELGKLSARNYFPRAKAGAYDLNAAIKGCFRARQEQAEGGLPVYDSMASCASRAGIPVSVQRAAKRKGCDAFRWNRVSLGALLRWLFNQSGDDTDWGDALKRFQALREEIKYEQDKQHVIDRAEVQEAVGKGMALVFGALEREFTVELPPVLKGLAEAEIQARLTQSIDGFKATLRAELLKFSKTQQKAKVNKCKPNK